MFDEKTDNLSLPLPHPENELSEDVGRLRDAFGKLDTACGDMRTEIDANTNEIAVVADAAAAARATASQAASAAVKAQEAADAAQTDADTAKQVADTARQAADTAKQAAGSAQSRADEAYSLAQSTVGKPGAIVVSPPVLSMASQMAVGHNGSVGIADGGVKLCETARYHVTVGSADPVAVAAVSGAATYMFAVRGEAGGTLSVSVVTEDVLGNRSTAATRSAALVDVSIAAAEIISPARGEQYVALQPSVKVADMVVIGGVQDTPRYLQVQVATDAAFKNIVFDTGASFAAPANKTVKVSTALELDTDYYVRARWTGTTFGQGGFGAAVAFHTIQAQVIGGCQTTTGVAGQTWARLDILGHALSTTPNFNAHPVYTGIVENLIDNQYMIGFPKCFVKREVLAGGTYAGKDARFLSDVALPGYEVHPAFLAHGGDMALDMVWIGKYQASADGTTKAASKSGVSPLVSIDFTTMQSRCTARNTGGVSGFHLWNIHELSLVQLLMLLELGGTDVQTLVGRGHVDNSPSGVQIVNHATVAQASWRGLVGLWGNIWQMCDGLRGGKNTSKFRINMGKGFVDTTIATCNASFDPDNMINASGDGWSASHLFIGDYSTKAASTDVAAYPDTQWLYANNSSYELVTYVGGHCSNAARAGLFNLYCSNSPTRSDNHIGGRLAKW